MKAKSVACLVFATCVVLSSAVAQANPATPMPVIDSAAGQLCGAVNADPTRGGVMDGFDQIYDRGLDDMDGALVTITAIHHVCPQHEALIMGTLDPIAAEEICTEQL